MGLPLCYAQRAREKHLMNVMTCTQSPICPLLVTVNSCAIIGSASIYNSLQSNRQVRYKLSD